MPPDVAELMTAVNHPLRRRILRIFVDEEIEVASASQLARTTKEGVAKVDYHLKTLSRCAMLRPVPQLETAERGGPSLGWALDVDERWLRLMLDAWAQSDLAG